jgi:hypothetical protein
MLEGPATGIQREKALFLSRKGMLVLMDQAPVLNKY